MKRLVTAALAAALLSASAPLSRAEANTSWEAVQDVMQKMQGLILTPAMCADATGILTPTIMDLDPTDAVVGVETSRMEGTEEVVALNTDLLFAFASSELSAKAEGQIGEIAKTLPKDTAIRVEGHTDSIGSNESNMTLSKARAKAVAIALGKARPDLKLKVKGYGETKPVAENETASGDDNPGGRAKNRRVELRFAR
ncbi:MAG: OmpA family protein [Propionibacteriaceae bacterium]|jgi:outer membrane protein OmpA-like peptidoglycan-associated protein|nr:OmpA family protein [Propionibacteriaceae bacterium]